MSLSRPKIAVHKFTSCDGCQLALLNAGEGLLALTQCVDIVHFAEMGILNPDAAVDIALIEGSVSTPEEQERILKIRQNSQYLMTIGACATSGGIQALRNMADSGDWVQAIYATPEHIHTLQTSTAIHLHVKVDFEIWGCPVNTEQVIEAIQALLLNAHPRTSQEPVCIDCKKKGYVCVMVTEQIACLGPVTRTGCKALCPSFGRGCYGCYGPSENPHPLTLGKQFLAQGHLRPEEIAQKFRHIHVEQPVFKDATQYFKGIKIIHEPKENN